MSVSSDSASGDIIVDDERCVGNDRGMINGFSISRIGSSLDRSCNG